MLFEHVRVPLMFGTDAVLVRAKSLAVSHDNISVPKAAGLTSNIQISLQDQGVMFDEGVPIETVLPDGECALDYMTVRSCELLAAVA